MQLIIQIPFVEREAIFTAVLVTGKNIEKRGMIRQKVNSGPKYIYLLQLAGMQQKLKR